MKTRQSDIYAAIESERAYQDAGMADADKPSMKPLNAGEIILAMEQCLAFAGAAWYYDSAPYPNTAEYIRKVAGLAVQFMEIYGAPQRKGYER